MTINDYVKKYDPENQFDVLKNYYKQVEYAWNNKFDLSTLKGSEFSDIVLSGLGGSAIAGDLAANVLGYDLKLPYIVNRNYSAPNFLSESTLFIASSYSGNTEETIESLKHAIEKKCKVVCITTGGKILEIAKENKFPVVILQKGFQPRFSIGLSFFSLLKIFQELDLISGHDKLVQNIIQLWKENAEKYSQEENHLYKIAQNLIGFTPIIYSADGYTNSLGMRLKGQFNENAKLHAFVNVFPEFNHNEIVGWETYSEEKLRAKVIYISDKSYHPQIIKRQNIVSGILKKCGVEIITLESNQEEFKVRLLDIVYTIDWLTYYVAILRKKDPSEIDNIHFLKKELEK